MTSRADQDRLDAIHALPCVACVIYQPSMSGGRVEAHHLVDKGTREASGGHQATIPLCAWHHRGQPPMYAMTVKECTSIFGPSLGQSKRAFVHRFGTERELLCLTDALMRNDAAPAGATGTG